MKALSSVSGISTETIRFFGLTLQPRSLQQMTMLVEEGIRERRNWIIANHNLHSVYLCHRHPRLRDFYSQVSWTHIDGMSLVALGRLYGYPLRREHRVTLADWTYPLMELAASSGWRVFHLGSSNNAAEKGAAKLRKLYPALQIEVSGGYFDANHGSSENEALIERINALRARSVDGGDGHATSGVLDSREFCAAKRACHPLFGRRSLRLHCGCGTDAAPLGGSARTGVAFSFDARTQPALHPLHHRTVVRAADAAAGLSTPARRRRLEPVAKN